MEPQTPPPAPNPAPEGPPAPQAGFEPPAPATPPPAPAPQEQNGFKPIQSQEDLDRLIGDRLARERNKYSDYDERVKESEEYRQWKDSQKDEVTRYKEQVEELTRKVSGYELKELKDEVGKDLPPWARKRLSGTTREELEADAAELMAELPPPPAPPQTPPPAPGNRPIPNGWGGGNPDGDEAFDPEAILKRIPRDR